MYSLSQFSNSQSLNKEAEFLRKECIGTLVTLPMENMSGLKGRIIRDKSDQRFEDAICALRSATQMVAAKLPNAFFHAPMVDVYITANIHTTETYWEPPNWYGHPLLFLKSFDFFPPPQDDSGERGVPHQIFNDHRHATVPFQTNGSLEERTNYYSRSAERRALATAWVVRELGRIIYASHPDSTKIFWENRRPEKFWKEKRPGELAMRPSIRPELAAHVSAFAGRNSEEFIIEVFTGLVHGKLYPESVLATYRDMGGPRIIGHHWNELSLSLELV